MRKPQSTRCMNKIELIDHIVQGDWRLTRVLGCETGNHVHKPSDLTKEKKSYTTSSCLRVSLRMVHMRTSDPAAAAGQDIHINEPIIRAKFGSHTKHKNEPYNAVAEEKPPNRHYTVVRVVQRQDAFIQRHCEHYEGLRFFSELRTRDCSATRTTRRGAAA